MSKSQEIVIRIIVDSATPRASAGRAGASAKAGKTRKNLPSEVYREMENLAVGGVQDITSAVRELGISTSKVRSRIRQYAWYIAKKNGEPMKSFAVADDTGHTVKVLRLR